MAPKTIIVTGASRGIGLAIANHLLKDPAQHNVVILGGRSKETLDKLKAESPKHIEVVHGDLSDFSLGQKAVDVAVSAFGKVDGLIVNHGILGEVARIADCNPDEIRKTFDVNFFSVVACWPAWPHDLPHVDSSQVKAAIPELRKTRGRILLTSSGGAIAGYATWGAYGSSKAAMNHLALTLNTEEPDITSIAIRPGVVDTEMQRELREVHHERLDKKDKEKFMSAKASGTLFRPDQPGNVMAKLVLGAPKEFSGQFLSWNDESLKAFQE